MSMIPDDAPRLTAEQQTILVQCFAESMTIPDAAEKAKCSHGQARNYRKTQRGAQRIRDMQLSTVMVRDIKNLIDVNTSLIAMVGKMEKRLCGNENSINKLRSAVAYQRLNLTKKRQEVRDIKAECKELKRILYKKTGLKLSDSSPKGKSTDTDPMGE